MLPVLSGASLNGFWLRGRGVRVAVEALGEVCVFEEVVRGKRGVGAFGDCVVDEVLALLLEEIFEPSTGVFGGIFFER